MALYKEIIRIVSRNIFVVGLVTFAVYFIADLVKPGLVTNYVNMNVLLLFVVLFGIVTVLCEKNQE